MSGPLIFVSRSRVKPGKRDAYEAHVADATELVESEEPQMIAFNSYASEDGTDVSTVQVHPDSESLDIHLKLFTERLSERAFNVLDSYEINVYGRPSDATLEFLAQMPSKIPGLRVRVLPVRERGFLRPQPM
jgi:quinol monooxygenase YgiN